jgi:hypothetical protein
MYLQPEAKPFWIWKLNFASQVVIYAEDISKPQAGKVVDPKTVKSLIHISQ